jgi:hypothetical protein
MAKVNYRLLKRQREESRKKEQLEKQAKRGRVPDATDAPPADGAAPAAAAPSVSAPAATALSPAEVQK